MLNLRIFLIAFVLCCPPTLRATTPQSVAQAVLDRLYAANGNSRFQKPKVIISPENKKVAAFSPWKNTITLDEKAYLICRGFGRDSLSAMAYILGHELVHACQAQIKGQRQRTNFLAYDQGYGADVRTEKVADIQGVFSAYLAGYGILNTMPEVIEKIYEEYGLKTRQLPGYPSLEERKATSREVVAIAQKLSAVFESCSYLLAIGQNGLACSGYEYILQYYQGPEIYNNLGVAYTLNARQFWNPQTDKYLYPLEADWSSKLLQIAAARGQEQLDPMFEALRMDFLDKAATNFREAAQLAPDYLPARINTVCALNMMGRPVEALRYAELNLLKGKGSAKKRKGQAAELVDLALGITYALLPGGARKAEAEAVFQRLSASPNALSALYAKQNLQELQGKTETGTLTEIPLPEALREVLSQMSLGRTGNLDRIPMDKQAGIWFAQKNSVNSNVIIFSNSQGNLISLMRFPNQLAAGVTVLPRQDDLANTAFGNIVAAKDGFYLKSPRDQAVLKIDARGRVLEMVKYIEHGK